MRFNDGMSKLPWPVAFVLAASAMLAGPLLLSIGEVDPPQVQAVGGAMKTAPIWLLVAVGTLVPALEALFWSAGFIECAQAIAKRPGLGAVLGALGYGPVFHHASDVRTIVAATWVAAVINLAYLRLHGRSRATAVLWAIGLRWVFAGFALLAYRDVI